MFNNLIESNSHRKEFKRRGSFLMFTTATYLLLFTISGIASIYAYDASLSEQNLEVVTMLPPVDLAPAHQPDQPASPRNSSANRQTYDVRRILMADVNQPTIVPPSVSVARNPDLPVRPGVLTFTGPADVTANLPGSHNMGANSKPGGTAVNVKLDSDAPPIPTPTPVVKRVINVSRVLNSQALSLPKPVYPTIARQAHVQGVVNVQVLIDESGRVISAKVVSGHPLLVLEAQQAALQARFSPTLVGDQPMKVSGVITYNFVMQ